MTNPFYIRVLGLILACNLPLAPLQAQDVAVEVSEAQIATLVNACSRPTSCAPAMTGLIQALRRANPDTALSTLIGSITAVVAERSNRAISGSTAFDVAAHSEALTALASFAREQDFGPLSSTVSAVALNVANRLPIDLGAIASGAGASVIDQEASPA